MKQNNLISLVKLGLTSDEARCYECLVGKGSLSVFEIAKNLSIFPNAVYRLTNKLQEKGFIISLDTVPVSFQAIPPVIAIEAFAEQKKREFEQIKLESISNLSKNSAENSQSKIDVVVGKNGYFKTFTKLAKDTKEEILVISLGESVSDEVKLATRDGLERGVDVKIVFHKYDNENKELLKTWVKMGCEVRHFPDSGYHLNVFDGRRSIFVANNPQNTEERTAMVIYSESVSRALKSHFYSIWEKGSKID